MRYDEIGLSILANRRREGFVAVGQRHIGPQSEDPPGVIQAVANAFGELIFMGVGLVASIAVFVFVSPLWGVVTAVALGGGYYLWRAYNDEMEAFNERNINF